MRKLVVTENMTVDGVIDMAAGWFDPLAEDVDQSDITAANTEHREAADALLVGRNTFEAFREFWPRQTDDPTGVSGYLNAVNKYVVSSTLGDPGWENATVMRGDLVADVQALKAAEGRDVVATGSVQLVSRADRRAAGRRVPALRLPRRGGPRCTAVRVSRRAAATARGAALRLRRSAASLCERRARPAQQRVERGRRRDNGRRGVSERRRAVPILGSVPVSDDLERRTTELLQELIRFDTVNPPGNEQAAQEFLRALLEGAGFEVELLSAVEGRPNLIARLGAPSDGPVLCLLGHIDTVLADPADWRVDPWAGELRDGCVWGRGAVDMKSQVAAEVAAAVALSQEGWRPAGGELKLVVTADEETGAEHGAKWLCERHPDKVRADMVVNEGAGQRFDFGDRSLYGVCTGEKGVFRFTVATGGRAGHASMPRIGDNALVKLAPVLSALAAAKVVAEVAPEPVAILEAMDLDPSDMAGSLEAMEAADERIATFIEPMMGVTLAPTMASASQKINVIPSHAEVKVDCRALPGQDADHALGRIHDAIGADGFQISFDETVVGNRSPADTPLMDFIRSFVAREDPGATVTPVLLPGFSDSRWFRAAFPDCVAYGFFPQRAMGLFEATPLMHGADERIPVEDLGLAARFYSELVQETLG